MDARKIKRGMKVYYCKGTSSESIAIITKITIKNNKKWMYLNYISGVMKGYNTFDEVSDPIFDWSLAQYDEDFKSLINGDKK